MLARAGLTIQMGRSPFLATSSTTRKFPLSAFAPGEHNAVPCVYMSCSPQLGQVLVRGDCIQGCYNSVGEIRRAMRVQTPKLYSCFAIPQPAASCALLVIQIQLPLDAERELIAQCLSERPFDSKVLKIVCAFAAMFSAIDTVTDANANLPTATTFLRRQIEQFKPFPFGPGRHYVNPPPRYAGLTSETTSLGSTRLLDNDK